MKPVYTLTLVLASCQPFDFTEDNPQPPKDALQPKMEAALTATIPVRPDHTVFVWFENKGYSSIVGNANAPYINTLIKRGTLFTNAFGRTHPSYPNYIAFFSGSRQGVRTDDCIDGTPFTCKTLYNVLYDKGVSFAWYSEGLPFTGSRTCAWGHYREKHNPTTIFQYTPKSVNRKFDPALWADTANFKNLPHVVCITPNMINDMHDGTVAQGDAWLKTHFSTYADWALRHNSLLVVYYDESENTATDINQIPVTISG